MKPTPVTKLHFVELRRIAGNCHATWQLFHNGKEFDVILLSQVVRVYARSLACGRKVRRITVNDLGACKWIILKNSERISGDESCDCWMVLPPPCDHLRVNVDSN